MRQEADHRHAETDPLGGSARWLPTYPIGKIAAEGTARAFAATLNLPTTIARLNVAYGPYGHGGLPMIMLRMMIAGEPIEVPPSGQNWCNPIHTDDIARQVPLLWQLAAVPAISLNWGGDEMVGLRDIADYLSDLTGLPAKFTTSDITRDTSAFDNTQRRALIGDCQIGWREGIKRALAVHSPAAIR
jgi:UDP-glucuronate 4-epimerase